MNDAVPIPARIQGLTDLADNLWWSWRTPARNLFRAVSQPLWSSTRHNPVRILQKVSPERLERLTEDAAFLTQYDQVMSSFESDLHNGHLWFSENYPSLRRTVAYFSAEFGLHVSLPIYSGGLGVLSGDYCKEASDLGVPLVGLGFIYPQGYFRQRLPSNGWQEAVYDTLNFDEVPLHPVLDATGAPLLVEVSLRGTPVLVQVWEVRAGRVHFYLMDANVPQNAPWDRELSAQLYGGDQETRIRQEIVLGLGGVRVLRALGIEPGVWHLNEGHSAFLVLERLREHIRSGMALDDAVREVQRTTVFTTHTPVPAGHDAFPFGLMDEYFGKFWPEIGVNREQFLALGEPRWALQHDRPGLAPGRPLQRRESASRRGVAADVAVGVARPPGQSRCRSRPSPMASIVPSWMSATLKTLFAQTLGRVGRISTMIRRSGTAWSRSRTACCGWRISNSKPSSSLLWTSETRQRWRCGGMGPSQVLASGVLLDPEALTIGFARRFATYKRATLIFRDPQRLKRLLHAEGRPMQIVFAGKAHPADGGGKQFIQQVYQFAQDPEFGGRVAFLEDYDMQMARFLVQGVDVWLNTPRRPNEASGTSGMKAAMNGVPNLSVLDGWWPEAYRPAQGDSPCNGWAFGEVEYGDTEVQDEMDSQALYRLLEDQVVPLYYDRDPAGVPRGWVRVMKEAIRTSVAAFSTRRMLKQYLRAVVSSGAA